MEQILLLAFFASALVTPQRPSLDSPSPKERQAAIEERAVLGNRDAIPELAAALKKEPKSDIRSAIVAALGRIRDRAAIPALSEALLTDFDKDVRLEAIDSLLRLHIPIEDPGTLRTIFNRVKSGFREGERLLVPPYVEVDPAAKDALCQALEKDFNTEVRAYAARALGSLKARDRLPILIGALEGPRNREHPEVRLELIQTLGLIGDPAAGPALEKPLRDRNTDVLQQAVLAIGLVGHKPARPSAEHLFKTHRNRHVRRRALQGISLMRDPDAIPFLESLLGHPNDYYREVAAEGLARLEYHGTPFKDRLAAEKESNVRVALAFALVSSGEDGYLDEIARALDSRQSLQAETYLYELGKYKGKLAELYRYLQSPNFKVRARMVKVIGDIGEPSSLSYVQPLTDDPMVEVAREAVAAMRKLNRAQ